MVFVALSAGSPGGSLAFAQSTSTDWAWTGLTQQDGLEFAYLFYREADNINNGIVLKLTNRNDYAVFYQFRIVFRTIEKREGGSEIEIPVSGQVEARSMLTGENAGLFFVPFKDGSTISEVGLRGYSVKRVQSGS